MHTPATALPGAQTLMLAPADQHIQTRVFLPRAVTPFASTFDVDTILTDGNDVLVDYQGNVIVTA